jgi:hypothetical protein
VKAIRSTTDRADSALYRLEKLINRALSNRLIKALKYIKAKFPNTGYITWLKFSSLITLGEDPRTIIRRINNKIY